MNPAVVSPAIRLKARRCLAFRQDRPHPRTGGLGTRRLNANDCPSAAIASWQKGMMGRRRGYPGSRMASASRSRPSTAQAGTPSAGRQGKGTHHGTHRRLARRISGMASPTMASTTPPQTPPKIPVMNRAASIAWYPGANAAAKCTDREKTGEKAPAGRALRSKTIQKKKRPPKKAGEPRTKSIGRPQSSRNWAVSIPNTRINCGTRSGRDDDEVDGDAETASTSRMESRSPLSWSQARFRRRVARLRTGKGFLSRLSRAGG